MVAGFPLYCDSVRLDNIVPYNDTMSDSYSCVLLPCYPCTRQILPTRDQTPSVELQLHCLTGSTVQSDTLYFQPEIREKRVVLSRGDKYRCQGEKNLPFDWQSLSDDFTMGWCTKCNSFPPFPLEVQGYL